MEKFISLAMLLAMPFVFVGGVVCSDGLRSFARMFSDEKHPTCIDGRVCVGAAAPKVFGLLNEDKHGLTALFCEGSANSASNIIFLDGIIGGSKCPGDKFTVELRSPTLRTLLKVEKGRLVEITEGTLHTIDV